MNCIIHLLALWQLQILQDISCAMVVVHMHAHTLLQRRVRNSLPFFLNWNLINHNAPGIYQTVEGCPWTISGEDTYTLNYKKMLMHQPLLYWAVTGNYNSDIQRTIGIASLYILNLSSTLSFQCGSQFKVLIQLCRQLTKKGNLSFYNTKTNRTTVQ